MMNQIALFLERVEQLEIKQAYQEITIEELNTTVILLQKENYKLKEQLRLLSDKLKNTTTSNIASLSEETPPPHY